MASLSWLPLMAQNAHDIQHRAAALEQQAQKYLHEQKPQLAIPLLRQIISLDPSDANAQGNLGVLLYFQGSYVDAIPHMRAALKLRPGLWRIEALLGIAEKRTADPRAAQNDLERAFLNLHDKKIQIQTGLQLIELDSASAELDKALSVVVKLLSIAERPAASLRPGRSSHGGLSFAVDLRYLP